MGGSRVAHLSATALCGQLTPPMEGPIGSSLFVAGHGVSISAFHRHTSRFEQTGGLMRIGQF